MVLEQTVRDLLLVTWEVDPAQVERNLPAGVLPALASERALVSLAASRATATRLGPVPAPPYAQIAIRTYVEVHGEPGIFIFQLRVSPAGAAAVLLGSPARPTFVTVASGRVSAAGLGVSFTYRVTGPATDVPALDPPLGVHDVAFWKLPASFRKLVTSHGPCAWRAAEIDGPPRFDPVLALGFDVDEPRWTHYAEATRFQITLPARKVELGSSRPSARGRSGSL